MKLLIIAAIIFILMYLTAKRRPANVLVLFIRGLFFLVMVKMVIWLFNGPGHSALSGLSKVGQQFSHLIH